MTYEELTAGGIEDLNSIKPGLGDLLKWEMQMQSYEHQEMCREHHVRRDQDARGEDLSKRRYVSLLLKWSGTEWPSFWNTLHQVMVDSLRQPPAVTELLEQFPSVRRTMYELRNSANLSETNETLLL